MHLPISNINLKNKIDHNLASENLEADMNLTQKITFLLLMVVGLMVSQATAKTQDILELAEQLRGVSGASKLICDVATYRHDALQQQKTFHVYTASQQQSLVVFKSDRDKGKKMLMKGKDFWMFMPKSRRPIRITPNAKATW